jgi:hypothetical protein
VWAVVDALQAFEAGDEQVMWQLIEESTGRKLDGIAKVILKDALLERG